MTDRDAAEEIGLAEELERIEDELNQAYADVALSGYMAREAKRLSDIAAARYRDDCARLDARSTAFLAANSPDTDERM